MKVMVPAKMAFLDKMMEVNEDVGGGNSLS